MQKGSTQELNNLAGVDRLVRIFLDLIAYDTTADYNSKAAPSSIGQLRLGAFLLAQLNKMDIQCHQTQEGVIISKIPATPGYEKAKKLCLLAHLDTSPDFSSENVNARLVKHYKGRGIELRKGLVLDHKICPELAAHVGDDIIVTDGNTLLGADDKAGVAILVMLMQSIVHNEDLVHGPLTIVFSVDEEIGKSCSYLDLHTIDSDFAVTIDGCQVGELDVATFNAMHCEVYVQGNSIHTSVAYKKLKNSLSIISEFIEALPRGELPQTTTGREGFYHPYSLNAKVHEAVLDLLVRDFEEQGMKARVAYLKEMAAYFNRKYGEGTVSLSFDVQYRNMHKVLKQHPLIVKLCKKAFAKSGVKVVENYVRGGTDGSNLSHMGLPCPNIFTGGLNAHGPYECLPVKAFNLAYLVTENLVKEVARYKGK